MKKTKLESEMGDHNGQADACTTNPCTDPPTQPLTPPAVLDRVRVEECALAPGLNRADLAMSAEFESDVARRGVVVPLLVRERQGVGAADAERPRSGGTEGRDGKEGRYEVFAGARRWTAALKGGLAEVPVAIYPAHTPTATMAELRLIENLQREDLSALDEAGQYQEALRSAAYGVGRAAVAALGARIGKSASHIYSRLRLLKLPKALHQAWAKGVVPQSIVELIAALPGEKDQLEALEEIATGESEWDPKTKSRKDVCMSVREARAYIAREFQSDLGKAIWALDDAELYPEAGPCTTCPFRGGHPEGAPGVEDPQACTRRSCYQKKRELTLKNKAAVAVADGKSVLSLKESEELFRYGSLQSSVYKAAADKCWADKQGRTYEQLLKGKGKGKGGGAADAERPRSGAFAVHAVDPGTGKVVKLYKNAGLNDALVAAGHNWARPVRSAREKPKPETAEAKAKRVEEEKVAHQVQERVIESVMKVVENPKLGEREHANLWAFTFACLLDEIGEPSDAFYKRRNMARSSLDSIRKLSPKSDLVMGNVRGECLEHLIMDYDGYREELLLQLAALCGVEVKAIEAKVRGELGKAVSEKAGKPVSGKKPSQAKAKAMWAKIAPLAKPVSAPKTVMVKKSSKPKPKRK